MPTTTNAGRASGNMTVQNVRITSLPFLCFGKEGALRGREVGDQIHTFSCLSVLHNAVVAWNTLTIGAVVEKLRAEGHTIDDTTLSLTTRLLRKHISVRQISLRSRAYAPNRRFVAGRNALIP